MKSGVEVKLIKCFGLWFELIVRKTEGKEDMYSISILNVYSDKAKALKDLRFDAWMLKRTQEELEQIQKFIKGGELNGRTD